MDPMLKRIGDVTIERVANKCGRDDMNSDVSSSELSSDDEALENVTTTTGGPVGPTDAADEMEKPSSKRKGEFEEQLNLKKIKQESDNESMLSDKEDGGELKDLTDLSQLTELVPKSCMTDNEDSEYDSDVDSDTESGIVSKIEPVALLDPEKTDFIEKLANELGEPSQKSDDAKNEGSDYEYDITEKLKEMGEISVETVKKGEKKSKSDSDTADNEISVTPAKKDSGSDSEDKTSSERKLGNLRRNIREVMDETQLDEATLAAQRQEMERLRRVQEQQRIIREVQRQIALNRQNNKTQHRVISLLQGNSSLIKQMPGTSAGTASRIGGTVLVKLPNGETKPMTRISKGQTPFEVVRLQKSALQGKVPRNLIPIKRTSGGNLTPSVSIAPVAKKIEPKTGSDSETESSDIEKKVQKVSGKPKDVVTISSSSDDDCIVLSEDEPDEPEPDEDPCNSGMHTNDAYNVPDEQGRVLINVGNPENEQAIFLAPQIARVIKPHQIGGVRFLFDNVIESTDRFSTSTGFGCILAHSMGLGKTLQVVCFCDIFLRHTSAKTVLCIMPINTLQNWLAEFNMWLPKDPTSSPLLSHGEVRPRNFNLHVLNDSHKTLAARAAVIKEWSKEGGVLLIGYELYRLLSLKRNPKSKSKKKKPPEAPPEPEDEEKNKTMFDEIHEALVKPGPDLVICDEGHRIKNSHASISHALKQIRSKRRIVLTGYPLQNNLLEYWCMVDFVRPNYLGTKTEFSNMFERPIQNGQCIDSTPQDIRLMRYRAHVLHSLLEGFVQRRSHSVLQMSLPQKEEYVLLVRMTEFQRKLYDTFMNEVVRTKTVPNPLKAFAVCCKIWNHPDVLYYFLKKRAGGEAVDIDLEEVAGTASTPSTPVTPKKGSRSKGSSKKDKKNSVKNSNAASPSSTKPAASVTPNTNANTQPTDSMTTSPNTPNPVPNIPNQSYQQPPNMQNPPYNHPPNYPGPPYPNHPYQNYQHYPQNTDYYQNQYPNNYNQNYYPNQEYGNYYEQKQEGYPNSYQPDGQGYWQNNQPNQYYNHNGVQPNDYYGNVNPSYNQPSYNQDVYRQNQFNSSFNQNSMYPPNHYQNQWGPDYKPEIKQEPDTKLPSTETKPPPKIEESIDLVSDSKSEEEKEKKDSLSDLVKEEEELKDPDLKVDVNLAVSKLKEDPGIPYDWATELLKGYVPGCIENSAKMEIFFCILQESMALGDRILLFSQSLFTLNLIEDFLQKSDVPGSPNKWARNKNYYRLDGSTSALEREKLINEYNSNPNIHLFLVSTRAGSLGINLVGANRVIVFDASWNPCHDTQAVCRVYRYGQKKPCFVYRIVMDNCLEKKIYDRQINKQGMADRVVDECNPDAHLSMKDVTNLCWDDEKDSEVRDFAEMKDKYIDVVMQKVLDAYSNRLSKEPFQHESLLIDRKEKKLSQAEKRLAKRSYELEKQANINSRPTYSYYSGGQGQGLQIRAIRTQDGMLQNKPVASVRPMQSELNSQLTREPGRPGGRSKWIPAEVWQRQGMTAQEMTLPLDVVIPTNSPDRGSIVLKAGQKVLVLKSPKGIYMQLECGKIVAIKTAFKVRGSKAPEKVGGEDGINKEAAPQPNTMLKKVSSITPNTSKTTPGSVPLPLKNNSSITVIPKAGQQRIVKPFTQTVTKLNMKSIRQPVPNLISRQVPLRMGGPRFTGKIQSIQRKVQLAKAKPYNLDKAGDGKMMDGIRIKTETDSHSGQNSDDENSSMNRSDIGDNPDEQPLDDKEFNVLDPDNSDNQNTESSEDGFSIETKSTDGKFGGAQPNINMVGPTNLNMGMVGPMGGMPHGQSVQPVHHAGSRDQLMGSGKAPVSHSVGSMPHNLMSSHGSVSAHNMSQLSSQNVVAPNTVAPNHGMNMSSIAPSLNPVNPGHASSMGMMGPTVHHSPVQAPSASVGPNSSNLHHMSANINSVSPMHSSSASISHPTNQHQSSSRVSHSPSLHSSNSMAHPSNLHPTSSSISHSTNLHLTSSNISHTPNMIPNSTQSQNLNPTSSSLSHPPTLHPGPSSLLHPTPSNMSHSSNIHATSGNMSQPPSLHPVSSNMSHPPTLHPTSNISHPANLHPTSSSVTHPPSGHPTPSVSHLPNMHLTASVSHPPNLHLTSNVSHPPNLHPSSSVSHPANLHSTSSVSHPPNLHPATSTSHPSSLHPNSNVSHPPIHHPTSSNISHPPSIHPVSSSILHPTPSSLSHPPNIHPTPSSMSHPTNLHQTSTSMSLPSNVHQTSSSISHPPSIHPTSSSMSHSSNMHQTSTSLSHLPNVHPSHPPNLHSASSGMSHSTNMGSVPPSMHAAAPTMASMSTPTNMNTTNVHSVGPTMNPGSSMGSGLVPIQSGMNPVGPGMNQSQPISSGRSSSHTPSMHTLKTSVSPVGQGLSSVRSVMSPSPNIGPNLSSVGSNNLPASNSSQLTSVGSSLPPVSSGLVQSVTAPVVHEAGNTNRSLKNYRHNFASQKNHSAKQINSSSALHQLEHTTSLIGEAKQRFQDSLDNITNSYGSAPTTSEPRPSESSHIIDLDSGKDDVEIIEKPTPPKTVQNVPPPNMTPKPQEHPKPSEPHHKPPEPHSKTIEPPRQDFPPPDYYNNYYGYNPLQPYPTAPQTYYHDPNLAYPDTKAKEVKPATTTAHRTETTTEHTTTAPTVAPAVPPAQAPPPVPGPAPHAYPTTPGSFTPYGQPGLPPQTPYDMIGYQQGQYSANYPGLPYPNQTNYQPPYQPPQYDQNYPANMYSAFHRPDMHQYNPEPYPQPPHFPIRNAYPHQYPYPNAAGQNMYPPPAPAYNDYQYNAAAAAAANGFPPAPFINPYPSLPNNNPVP